MRAEPGRHSAGRGDRLERGELRVPVEPIARLALEGGRARAQHPAAVPLDGRTQVVGTAGARRPHRREDPPARGVQLLVARAAGSQRELLDAVAEKARVRVAVDEPGDRAQSAAVELLDVAVEGEPRELVHRSGHGDPPPLAEDECLFDDLDFAERSAADRSP